MPAYNRIHHVDYRGNEFSSVVHSCGGDGTIFFFNIKAYLAQDTSAQG